MIATLAAIAGALAAAAVYLRRREKELDEYEAEDFTSEPADLDKTYYRNRTLVVGHVPTTELGGDGRIVKKNNNIAIDCGCGRGGQMGIFCLNNGAEMYV